MARLILKAVGGRGVPLRARLAAIAEQAWWETRRGVRGLNRRVRASTWGALVLVLIAGALLLWQEQQREQLQALRARLREQASERAPVALPIANVAVSGAADMSDGRARLRAFENYLLPHEDIPAVVQDLLRLAEAEGLSMQRGEYRPQVDLPGGFLRYRISLPVKGPALAIHHFIQTALREQKTLALDSVQFKRERIDALDIEARIEWEVLTRLPGHRSTTTGTTREGAVQ